jgi:hypothetical protein
MADVLLIIAAAHATAQVIDDVRQPVIDEGARRPRFAAARVG